MTNERGLPQAHRRDADEYGRLRKAPCRGIHAAVYRGIVACAGKFSAYLSGAGGRQCVGTADPPAFMRYARSALISPIFDLNPLERARMELKLAPGFLVRSAPKSRGVVDRVGA